MLIADGGKEEEAITRLSRVGFDGTLGFLKGGIEAWIATGKAVDTVEGITATALKGILRDDIPIFDVRKETEFQAEHLEQASLTPLDFLNEHLAEFPEDRTFYLHCAGGYRSMIAASILKSRGIHNLVDVAGGFGAIKEAGIPTTNFVCPSTIK